MRTASTLRWLLASSLLAGSLAGCGDSSSTPGDVASDDTGSDGSGGDAADGDTVADADTTEGDASDTGGDTGTPAGLTVTSDDGNAVLTIPEGALPASVDPGDITIRALGADERGTVEGAELLAAYELLPDGLVLSAPATLVLSADIGSGIPLVLHYDDETVEVLGATVDFDPEDVETMHLTVQLSHFSDADYLLVPLDLAGIGTITIAVPSSVAVETPFTARAMVGLEPSFEFSLWRSPGGDLPSFQVGVKWQLATWTQVGGGASRFVATGPVTPHLVDAPEESAEREGASATIDVEFVCDDAGAALVWYYTTARFDAQVRAPGGDWTNERLTSELVAPEGTVHCVSEPTSVEYLYYTDAYGDVLSGYRVGSLTALSGSPFSVGRSVREGVTTPDGHFLYASSESTTEVVGFAIDPTTGNLTTIDGSPFASTAHRFLAVSADGSSLYVSHSSDTDNLTAFRIDGDTGALTEVDGSPYSAGGNLGAIVPAADGAFVYVVDVATSHVFAFGVDADTGALTALDPVSYDLGGTATGAAVADPAGEHVYVNTRTALVAYSVDADTGALTAVEGSPFTRSFVTFGLAMHPSGDWIVNGTTVFARNGDTGVLTEHGTLSIAEGFEFESLAQDGAYLFALNYGDPADRLGIYRFSATTGDATELEDSPYELAGQYGRVLSVSIPTP